MTEVSDFGWLDANVFVHPFYNNPDSARCARILMALESGKARARLDHVIIHEVIYALRRHLHAMGEANPERVAADYLMGFVQCENIEVAERDVVLNALELLRNGTHVTFADAMLEARHRATGIALCTTDAKHLGQLPNTYDLVE